MSRNSELKRHNPKEQKHVAYLLRRQYTGKHCFSSRLDEDCKTYMKNLYSYLRPINCKYFQRQNNMTSNQWSVYVGTLVTLTVVGHNTNT